MVEMVVAIPIKIQCIISMIIRNLLLIVFGLTLISCEKDEVIPNTYKIKETEVVKSKRKIKKKRLKSKKLTKRNIKINYFSRKFRH